MYKNDKRRLREKAGSFLVTSGELFHKGQDNNVARVIVDDEEKIRVIRQLHEGVVGGHFGQTATILKTTDRFWWPGVAASVRDFVRKCDACQKANPLNKPPPAELHPVKVSHIFHRWGIDLVGPLKETAGRKNVHYSRNRKYLESGKVVAFPSSKKSKRGRKPRNIQVQL